MSQGFCVKATKVSGLDAMYQRNLTIIFPNEAFESFRTISNIFLLMYQLGSCCVYVVFVGQNLSNVINNYTEMNERLVMVMILLPLILITYIRNLKFLAPLTTVANGITVISFGIIYYYIFQEDVTFEGRLAIGDVKNWPLFFGTVCFALESIGMVSCYITIFKVICKVLVASFFRNKVRLGLFSCLLMGLSHMKCNSVADKVIGKPASERKRFVLQQCDVNGQKK